MGAAEAEDLGAAVDHGVGGTLNRMFQAVTRIFEPTTSIDFSSVDGVYRPEEVPVRGRKSSRTRRGRRGSHRIYTAGARPNHVHISSLGDNVDVRV